MQKGISLFFTLPTTPKTKNIIDVALTQITGCYYQICIWNDLFYKEKTRLFRLRAKPEQDRVKIVVCNQGSKFESTQTVYKEKRAILLKHYKSIKQLVFKTTCKKKKGHKYNKDAIELVYI